MRELGIWSETLPTWVQQYGSDGIPDVWEWLQFVYLPMRKENRLKSPHYLAPVVTLHIRGQIAEHSLLIQRIVELDSMTSTLAQT